MALGKVRYHQTRHYIFMSTSVASLQVTVINVYRRSKYVVVNVGNNEFNTSTGTSYID